MVYDYSLGPVEVLMSFSNPYQLKVWLNDFLYLVN